MPGMGGIALFGRRYVGAKMHPAMPARRNKRSFGIAVIEHPAPVQFAMPIITVAEFVGTDIAAVKRGPHPEAKGLPLPPDEKLCK